MNLMENWINGNLTDVAEELMSRGPGAIAKFAAKLERRSGGNKEVDTLAKLLDSALEKRLDAQRLKGEPETPW